MPPNRRYRVAVFLDPVAVEKIPHRQPVVSA